MKDTEYAYAVARIRANETKLISGSELSAVISAAGYNECVRRLKEKGYEIEGSDYLSALEKKLSNTWELIESVLPDRSQFNSVLIKNDFHNLKVALKALVSDKSADGLFASPSVYSPAEIKKYVFSRENECLPEELRHADRSAYRILTKTGFAALSDAVIDRASLECSLAFAKKADNEIMLKFAEAKAALTDIKVLYRCVLTGKAKSFMERAVCECSSFSKKDIIEAADGGKEALFEFLSHTPFSGAADALKESASEFEKYVDDILTDILSVGKSEAFGISALLGYYFAVNTEIMNLRIILSGKLNGLPDGEIRERMRKLYV
ncbi:MAG: V-type ATPase subunit [Oscillospiraceae bacterium]|nr:V-type ATPase subunit [Oscillospiraceae bacterium]